MIQIGARKLEIYRQAVVVTTALVFLLGLVAAGIAGSTQGTGPGIWRELAWFLLGVSAAVNLPMFLAVSGNGVEWLARGIGARLGARPDDD